MTNQAEVVDLASNETKTEAGSGKFETFDKLYRVNIQKYQKNKRGDYLPWSMSWALFKQHRPDATYVFEADRHFPSGELETVCTVTSQGESLTMILPCLDNTMKPLKNPSRHAVNTCRMRCLTKCIAMFGLGLSCWNWVAIDEIEDFGGAIEVPAADPVIEAPAADPVIEVPAADPVIATEADKEPLDEKMFAAMLAAITSNRRDLVKCHVYFAANNIAPNESQIAALVEAECNRVIAASGIVEEAS